jgi:predicted transcriptional regulator
MGNRDRHDIVMEILDKSKNGKKKTEIIRDVGLSYAQSKQYLKMLTREGMLELDSDNAFRTSKKGLEFMMKCGDCFLCDWHQQKMKIPHK